MVLLLCVFIFRIFFASVRLWISDIISMAFTVIQFNCVTSKLIPNFLDYRSIICFIRMWKSTCWSGRREKMVRKWKSEKKNRKKELRSMKTLIKIESKKNKQTFCIRYVGVANRRVHLFATHTHTHMQSDRYHFFEIILGWLNSLSLWHPYYH